MKIIKQLLFTAFLSLVLSMIVLSSERGSVSASEFELNEMQTPLVQPYALTKGHIKALNIRMGFSDYPANDSNPIYVKYSDNYIKSFFEGKDGGFGLPYNGINQYLEKSSYGNLTMEMGEIIDIQMDNSYKSYFGHVNGITGQGFINDFLNNEEFRKKLFSKINISDYDSDGDGGIDVIYIWGLIGDSYNGLEAYNSREEFENNIMRNIFFEFDADTLMDDKMVLDTIIHEIGHQLIGLGDYYIFNDYVISGLDIGNIMGFAGYGHGDYDACSKWKAGWLGYDNVTGIHLTNGDSDNVSLTPYDSDSAEGKKIIFFDYDGDGYIAVDFCGGINNNDFDTDLRKRGFRFYKMEKSGSSEVEGIYNIYNKEQNNYYQLFAEGDDIDLLADEEYLSLKISNIQTGDNPSFTYSFTNNTPESETEKTVDYDNSFQYRVMVINEEGDILSNNHDIKYLFENITDSQKIVMSHQVENTFFYYYNEGLEVCETLLLIDNIPDGYQKLKNIKLKASSKYDEWLGTVFDVETDSNDVSVTYDHMRGDVYLITVTLKKESQTEIDHTSDSSAEDMETVKKKEKTIRNEKHMEISEGKTKYDPASKTHTVNAGKESSNTNTVTKVLTDKTTTTSPPQTGEKNIWPTIAGATAAVMGAAVFVKKKMKI